MSTKSLLPLQFVLQALAFLVFFMFSDPVETTNELVSGLIGVCAGLVGIAFGVKANWDKASKLWFCLASLCVAIGWGSWVVIAPRFQANDPVINITWLFATLGWFLQILLVFSNKKRA